MYLYWSFLCKLLLCCKFENRHCKVVICQNRLLRLFSTSDNYGTMQKHVKREVKFFSQQVIDPSFHVFSTALIISVHIHFLLLIRTCQSTSTVALHNAVNIWLNYRIPLESKSPRMNFWARVPELLPKDAAAAEVFWLDSAYSSRRSWGPHRLSPPSAHCLVKRAHSRWRQSTKK